MGERITLCPFCGAYEPRSCEMREEMNGICPWEEMDDDDDCLEDDEDHPHD